MRKETASLILATALALLSPDLRAATLFAQTVRFQAGNPSPVSFIPAMGGYTNLNSARYSGPSDPALGATSPSVDLPADIDAPRFGVSPSPARGPTTAIVVSAARALLPHVPVPSAQPPGFAARKTISATSADPLAVGARVVAGSERTGKTVPGLRLDIPASLDTLFDGMMRPEGNDLERSGAKLGTVASLPEHPPASPSALRDSMAPGKFPSPSQLVRSLGLDESWAALFDGIPPLLLRQLERLGEQGVKIVSKRRLAFGHSPEASCEFDHKESRFILRILPGFARMPIDLRIMMLAHETDHLERLLGLADALPMPATADSADRRREAWARTHSHGTIEAAQAHFEFEQHAMDAEERFGVLRPIHVRTWFQESDGRGQEEVFSLEQAPARLQFYPVHEAVRSFLSGTRWDFAEFRLRRDQPGLGEYLRSRSYYPVLARLIEPAFVRMEEVMRRIFDQEISRLVAKEGGAPSASAASELRRRLEGMLETSSHVSQRIMTQGNHYDEQMDELMYHVFIAEAETHAARFADLRNGAYFKTCSIRMNCRRQTALKPAKSAAWRKIDARAILSLRNRKEEL